MASQNSNLLKENYNLITGQKLTPTSLQWNAPTLHKVLQIIPACRMMSFVTQDVVIYNVKRAEVLFSG